MRGIDVVATPFERLPRRSQWSQRPAEVARDERDLGFGDHAARASYRLLGAEGPCRPPQQLSGATEVAELSHRDPAQGQCRRIVA